MITRRDALRFAAALGGARGLPILGDHGGAETSGDAADAERPPILWDQMVKGIPVAGIPSIVGAGDRPVMEEYHHVRADGTFLVLLGMGPLDDPFSPRSVRVRGDVTTTARALLNWRRLAWEALEAGGGCRCRDAMDGNDSYEAHTVDLSGAG